MRSTLRLVTLGLTVCVSTLLITACGGGSSAIDGARNDPNDFSGGASRDDSFSESSTGDSTNTSGLANNEVRVTLEVPGSYAPDEPAIRRNLRVVPADRITVYTSNTALQQVASVDVSQRTDSDGSVILAFPGGLPLGPDVLIEARYGNAVLRAMASDADRDIKVNPFSEYLVRYGLASYTAGELDQLQACIDATFCLNKYVWSTLADQVQDFEIELPSNATVDTAIDVLHNRGDFASYVSHMADYALLDDSSSGKISVSSADYNSVFLSLGLGQSFAESSISGAGAWSTQTAQEEKQTNNAGTGYVYPALTLASFDAFNIKVTSLATDIPYDRDVLLHADGNNFYRRGPEVWDRNTHSSSPGAATLQDGVRLLAGRSLYQSITGRGSSRVIGWTRNPYYLDAYVSAPARNTVGPDRVLASYFDAGKAIELDDSGGQLTRGATLENTFSSVFELHLLRPASGTSFDPTVIYGGQYNVVYLASRYDNDALPLALEAGLGTWSVGNDGTINQGLARSIVRQGSSGAVIRDESGTITTSWLISNRLSRLSNGDRYIGRLNLDIGTPTANFATPDIGMGASTPDGSLLAFNLDRSVLGNGLLIAAERPGTTPAPPASGRYRIQGVIAGVSGTDDRLRQLNDAVLTLTSSTSAQITGESISIVHDVAADTVTPPAATTENHTLAYSSNVPAAGQVQFTDGTLTLDGFFSADQSQLFLRARETDTDGRESVGLVLATRLP